MNKKSSRPLLVISLLICSTLTFSQKITVEQYQLENGLTVILCEDHSLPEVAGAVVVKAGGRNDPADATGMAHYMEHMLFKGTEELGTLDWEQEKPLIDRIFALYDDLEKTTDPDQRREIQAEINRVSLEASQYAAPNEFSNLTKSIGGTNLNAGTGWDMTLFYNSFPPHQMEKWLELNSHRFINPVFRAFQAELETVYEEKNMYDDNFMSPLFEEFNRHFFKTHPYGQQTLIGTTEDLKNPSLTKMRGFFDTWYVANNMAMILAGNFDAELVKPLIASTFGRLKRGDIPVLQEYTEQPFSGRELVEKKMSPVRLALLGFRTPPDCHEDQAALDVCNGILTNENSSGLLDRLVANNRLMMATIFSLPYTEFGSSMVVVVPKLIGQKLEHAERLVMDQIDSLREGRFEEWMVDAIKMELYRNRQLELESNSSKMYAFAMAFSCGQQVAEYLSYTERVKEVTMDDVVRVAKNYYNDNYLAFFSRMGSIKKEKIAKPGYQALTNNHDSESEYSKRFRAIPAEKPEIRYVDFEKDLHMEEIRKNYYLYAVRNKKNDIFTLTLKFGIGNDALGMLEPVAQLMNYAEPAGYTDGEFKKQFSKIGCAYYVYSDDDYLTVELTGIDERLPDALHYILELLTNPEVKAEHINMVYQEAKGTRKIERSDPQIVADGLFEYANFGGKSKYINRPSLKDIKKLHPDSARSIFLQATSYRLELHYCGGYSAQHIKEILNIRLVLPESFHDSRSPVVFDPLIHGQKTIYFTPKKRARQSNIYFLVSSKEYDIASDAGIQTFNTYFGGDFSGLVLQEVREYRSLAYAAYAFIARPPVTGKQIYLKGYIGTQSDKTAEALEVFCSLVDSMPEKPDRIPMIREYLVNSAQMLTPGVRDISATVAKWKLSGYKEDPRISHVAAFGNLSFEDIRMFYRDYIHGNPLVICLSGNKKMIDIKELGKHGHVVKVKEKNLFKK